MQATPVQILPLWSTNVLVIPFNPLANMLMHSSILGVTLKAPVTKASSCNPYPIYKLTVILMLTLLAFTIKKNPKTLTVYAAKLVMLFF